MTKSEGKREGGLKGGEEDAGPLIFDGDPGTEECNRDSGFTVASPFRIEDPIFLRAVEPIDKVVVVTCVCESSSLSSKITSLWRSLASFLLPLSDSNSLSILRVTPRPVLKRGEGEEQRVGA